MVIGNLIIDGGLFLAPLAGISNYPFRLLARRFGASLCYTEMISADAVSRDQEKTVRMLDMAPDEHPIGVQLFGSSPEYISRAVRMVERHKPDLIDINIGCPVKKVIKKNGGAALLKDPILAAEVLAAAVESTSLPVTAKMRTGWKKNSDIFIELGKKAEKVGVAAITLHPRSRSEGYQEKSDWSKIALLKKEISIPVIGNGDINTAMDAEAMILQTGCDAIMIGRAAMRNPYVFRQIKSYLAEGIILNDLSIQDTIELALEHSRLMVKRFGERYGILMMRKHLAWYTRGFSGGAEVRRHLKDISTYDDICRLFEGYRKESTTAPNG